MAEVAAVAPEATAAGSSAAGPGAAEGGAAQATAPQRAPRRRSPAPAAAPAPAPVAAAQGAPPRNYALLQGQTRSGWGAVLWTLVVSFTALLLAGLILIPGRSGQSGAGALSQVLDWFDGLIRGAVSTRPFFQPKGASG